MRLEGILPASPQEALKLIDDAPASLKQKWDPLFDSYEVVEKVTPNIDVIYNTFKAVFPVSKRDSVALKCFKVLNDGTHVVYGQSISHYKKPITNQYVRAKGMSALFCVPIPGEPNKCRMIKMTLANPMGSIPLWVINLMKTKSAEGIPILISCISELVSKPKISDSSYISDTESEEYYDADAIFEDETTRPKTRIEEEIEAHQSLKSLLKQLEDKTHTLDNTIRQLESTMKQAPSTLEYLFLIGWPLVGISVYHYLRT